MSGTLWCFDCEKSCENFAIRFNEVIDPHKKYNPETAYYEGGLNEKQLARREQRLWKKWCNIEKFILRHTTDDDIC